MHVVITPLLRVGFDGSAVASDLMVLSRACASLNLLIQNPNEMDEAKRFQQ
jgi:hypothetical protein